MYQYTNNSVECIPSVLYYCSCISTSVPNMLLIVHQYTSNSAAVYDYTIDTRVFKEKSEHT